MNSAIELHDSKVDEVAFVGQDLLIEFRPAYVHRSKNRPAVDSGWGYLIPVEFIFLEATFSETGNCQGEVSGGAVTSENEVFQNVVPVPLRIDGSVTAYVEFKSGGMLSVKARGFVSRTTGEADPDFCELFEC